MGKLGGFNAQNLQLHAAADEERSHMAYDVEGASEAMGAYMHALGEAEYRDDWARVKCVRVTSRPSAAPRRPPPPTARAPAAAEWWFFFGGVF